MSFFMFASLYFMSKIFLRLLSFFWDEEGSSILFREVRNCEASLVIFCGLQNVEDLFLFLGTELYWEARCLVWCSGIQVGRKFVSVSKQLLYRSSLYGSEDSQQKAQLIILCPDVWSRRSLRNVCRSVLSCTFSPRRRRTNHSQRTH